MIKRNGYLLTAVLFSLSFMTACSKNLMPPEGLDGAAPVGSQMSQSSDSRGGAGSGAGGGAGRGFNIAEQGSGSGSGFLTEQNVGESARSGGFSSGGSDDGSALGGGRFQSDAEPFLGNDSGSGSGSGSGFGSGTGEARTLPFKDTGALQDIHFKFDRNDLDNESRATLRRNASYLKANSSAVIEIQGHCDERGTNNYNVALGERRAHSTKMYLVSQGVSARRIHTISYGEERPFCFDSNVACWQKNRRAHFRVSE
jgi:peptidoglycan-associated lipoprotein